MTQKSTTTTSFIISSNESLNKPSLSSSQSSESCDYTTASDSSQNNRYTSSLNPISNTGRNDMLNQQNRFDSTMPSAQPPQTYPSSLGGGVQIYGSHHHPQPSSNLPVDAMRVASSHQIQESHSNLPNGNAKNSVSDTYMSYQQNGDQQLNQANSSHYPVHQFSPSQAYTTSGDIINNNNPSVNSILSSQSNHVLGNINNSSTPTTNYNNGHNQPNKFSAFSNSNNSTTQVQSFQQGKSAATSVNDHRSSHSSLESSNSCSMMPLNVKSMLVNGVSSKEVLCNWLKSIKCEEYKRNFIDNGYDMPLLARVTPQDLTAIGCKSLEIRKKLLSEIKKLNLDDGIPECRPVDLRTWLELLKLNDYFNRLCDEGYDTIDKVCELTWEDLEDIGITRLGHQKRLLLGIERVLKYDKQQEERQNDFAIYDVHPNHRISLNPSQSDNRLSTTISRSKARSGFFQTKSGANLDHRGLPVATVMPALKHVNNSLANFDISRQVLAITDMPKGVMPNYNGQSNNNRHSVYEQSNQMQSMCSINKSLPIDDQTTTITMRRNPPPLPPVRTNSLKMPQDTNGGGGSLFNNNKNLIYGNNYGVTQNTGINNVPMTIGSTSFLRTPKLGTLTPTTNKMLTLGGHIQSINGHPTMVRSIMPFREAPLPPIPAQHLPGVGAGVGNRIEEEPIAMHSYSAAPMANGGGDSSSTSATTTNKTTTSAQLMNQSLIGHQLASADEFPPPPPPPCQ